MAATSPSRRTAAANKAMMDRVSGDGSAATHSSSRGDITGYILRQGTDDPSADYSSSADRKEDQGARDSCHPILYHLASFSALAVWTN